MALNRRVTLVVELRVDGDYLNKTIHNNNIYTIYKAPGKIIYIPFVVIQNTYPSGNYLFAYWIYLTDPSLFEK